MYKFNGLLFGNISYIVGMTHDEVADVCGISRSTFNKWRKSESPSIDALVRFCNYAHVSMAHFIIDEATLPKIGKRDDYVLPPDTWVDIEYHPTDIGYAITAGAGRQVQEACKHLDIARSKFYRYFHEGEMTQGEMKVTELIDLFNRARLYPGGYIIDCNADIVLLEGYEGGMSIEQKLAVAMKRIEQLTAENARIRTILRRIQQSYNYQLKAAEDGMDIQ